MPEKQDQIITYGSYNIPRFKAAAVQASPVIRDAPQWLDLQSTLNKAISLITEAGRNGARLIVFPETFLPCYPYWSVDFSDRAGFGELWANLLWNSVEVPSRETEALCEAAKKADAYVVMGINERDSKFPGRMYNSALYLSPRGEVMGTHRKICITVNERYFHAPGDGGENLKTVFKTDIGKLGGSLCGEHTQLPLLYNWIMQGIQVHCSLWPGIVGLQNYIDIVTRSLCRTGYLFGVLSSTYIPEKNMPKNFYKNSYFNIPGSTRGGSGIISPTGEYIAGPVYDEETIVYGDIDLSEIDKVRHVNNLTGNYSRWDLFSLNVRQDTYQPLVPMENPEGVLLPPESKQIRDLESRIKELEQQIANISQEMVRNSDKKKN
ncbi:nitrilase-related carbon-nitrogen hydrolase [Chloroflexota bacterium]